MSWKEECYAALRAERLFEDAGHQSRFKELVDCFGHQPFFTKGLCKCIYLSAWDDEHFCIMLDMLNTMCLDQEISTREMRDHGDVLAERQEDAQAYIYLLSNAFLDGASFHLAPGVEETLPPDIRYIITRALQASKVIDRV